MSVTDINDPLNHSLTEEDCRARSERPLYVGDFVSFRFQLLTDDGTDAVNLDDYTFVFTITNCQGETFTRTTGVALAGHASLDQIEIDDDQGTGDEDATTGKGWLEVFFSDTDDFDDVLGLGTYKLVATTPTDRPFTMLRGDIEVVE